MKIIRDVTEMQNQSLAWEREGRRIALVPTMGALHDGHLELVRRARESGDCVVMSLFVNPTQFGPNEDFAKYPRMFDADCKAAESAGADAVFAPTPEGMYSEGFQTYVTVEEIARPLCGVFRPIHFRGVATIVLKLFNIVRPASAVFGWKDAQQFILLCRMVKDMNLPIEMIGVETLRESDGLAKSSRNQYLSETERANAPTIYRALTALRDAAQQGERSAEKLIALAIKRIEAARAFEIQYLEMVSLDRLKKLDQLEPGNTLVAVAAMLGKTRLIDNIRM